MNSHDSRTPVIDIPVREAMRMAGDRVCRDRVIEVRYPWTGELVGTVPMATRADVDQAFRAAHQYRPTLTRHQRHRILSEAARLLGERRPQVARLITLESGLCLKDSLYEVGRACDVLMFSAQQALIDDGQSFSCDLTEHGRQPRVHTLREPLLGVTAAITPFNHPLHQGCPKVTPRLEPKTTQGHETTDKAPASPRLQQRLLLALRFLRHVVSTELASRSSCPRFGG